jgi:ferritin-like protein
MASVGYHESADLLTDDTRNMHRAIVSLMEEWEAIDWYRQRADASSDPQLKEVLLHNKREEIEHATMLLEWIRRHDDHFDRMLRRYLFTDTAIVAIEAGADSDEAGTVSAAVLGIGSMKKGE